MGREDAAARFYLSDPERFADMFNHEAFGGEGVIDPSELREADTSDIAGGTERRRDIFKRWVPRSGGRATYAILGLEEQTNGHMAMPVRCALYDAMAYAGQARELARENRREGMDGASSAEFLSGLREGDRLRPVVTIVFYMSGSDWTWPETLHGMLDEGVDGRLMRLLPDYRLNLVVPVRMSNEELDAFSTELGLAIKYMKYSSDKDGLARMVEEDGRYRSVDAETAAFLNVVTKSGLEIEPREGRVDMCKAIDDMRAEERLEGKLEGLRSLMENTGWGLPKALDALGVRGGERDALAARLDATA